MAIKKDTIIWVCGQWLEIESPPYYTWGVMGLYLKEEDAIKKCKTWEYFVGPLILNKTYPSALSKWEGIYYPKEKEGPKGICENKLKQTTKVEKKTKVSKTSTTNQRRK